MTKLLISFVGLFVTLCVQAQIQEPVKFTTELKQLSDSEVEIVFNAAIAPGWHVYSTELGDGGPISATFNVESMEGIEPEGKLQPAGQEIAAFDKVFEMNVRYFERTARFVQRLKITAKEYHIAGYLEYGACSDENCLPPSQAPFEFGNTGKETVGANAPEVPAKDMNIIGGEDGPTSILVTGKADYWQPVIQELKAHGEAVHDADTSWLYIFGAGFFCGLLAIVMPCIWHIIALTVCFFLMRNKVK